MFRHVATRTSLSYFQITLNLTTNRINSFVQTQVRALRPLDATPPFACTHHFSSASRTLIANFLCQLHLLNVQAAPPLPLNPLSLALCLAVCSENYICTISNTAQQLARLFYSFCPSFKLLTDPVCNLCEYKKKSWRVYCKLTRAEKLRAFHRAERVMREGDPAVVVARLRSNKIINKLIK